jgi:hypothetical protein
MGRPRTAKHPKPVEPEDEVQVSPEEEPAAVIEPPSVNQAELVRKAIAAGHEKPATGVPYIKSQFGVDIDPKYYSVAKSQLKKKEAASEAPKAEPAKRGRKPKAFAPVVVHTPATIKSAANGQVDLIQALEAMKPLVASLGKEQAHRLIELLG